MYPTVGISTGIVIDSYDNTSDQIDIIIYDKQIVPPFMFNVEEGIIPCESVLMTIEVKSRLTKKELKKSVSNAISVKKLTPVPSIIPRNSNNHVLHSIVCSVFAFDTDLKDDGENEYPRLEKVVEEVNKENHYDYKTPISNLCIASKILCYCVDAYKKKWETVKNEGEYNNILHFINIVMSSCKIMASERTRPFIDNYFS
jgi:hypothetical protein